ncbi:MAG: hypothetical protein CVV23_17235, partial [Ignavibacteriae bacterium HGW-Ignavibacteriae-2]
MKKSVLLLASCLMLFMIFSTSQAQTNRSDVIWARTTAAGTLTLDGNLTEPAWDKAEELKIVYG